MFNVTVTYPAAEYLDQMLAENDVPVAVVVRMVLKDDAISFVEDKMRSGDQTFTHGTRIVLVLDEEMSQLLANQTLDIKYTDDGADLELKSTGE